MVEGGKAGKDGESSCRIDAIDVQMGGSGTYPADGTFRGGGAPGVPQVCCDWLAPNVLLGQER